MAKDDGGSAFPHPDFPGISGMKLRDWFAGMALQGLIAAGDFPIEVEISDVVGKAYIYADTMLIARKG